jgi:SEC-C motif
MARNCKICGKKFDGQLERAREHVIPKWLLRDLSIVDAPVSPTVTGGKNAVYRSTEEIPKTVADVVWQRGPHTLDGFLEGRVCKPCNNNLLNRFETTAKPTLRSLIKCELKVRDLSDSQRVSLARWALKTTLVFKIAFGDAKNLPTAHLDWLHNFGRRIPDGVSVFAQQHENDGPFFWMGGSTWTAEFTAGTSGSKAEVLRLSDESYKLCLQLGPLLLLTAYWPPIREWSPGFWSAVHIPCWRDARVKVLYKMSHEKFPWKKSREATVVFSLGLRLYKLSEETLEAHRRVPKMSKSGPVILRDGKYQPVKVGRNAPCPCGSGLKFKHCCGQRGKLESV